MLTSHLPTESSTWWTLCTSFAMIPITIGRMRGQLGSLVRVLELNNVVDISTQIGTSRDGHEHDTTSFDEVNAPAEILASIRSIEGALAEAHQDDVYESVCWLGPWRPESNPYLADFRRVSRGLLPAGWLRPRSPPSSKLCSDQAKTLF